MKWIYNIENINIKGNYFILIRYRWKDLLKQQKGG